MKRIPSTTPRKSSSRKRMDDKLPRGHAYIHMRNRGYTINIDYFEVDSEKAEQIIRAVMALIRDFPEEDVAVQKVEEAR